MLMPASNLIFQVDPINENKLLPEEQVHLFHWVVFQLLLIFNHLSQDICTVVEIHNKIFKEPE